MSDPNWKLEDDYKLLTLTLPQNRQQSFNLRPPASMNFLSASEKCGRQCNP
jgi:hypothetical protein